MNIVNSNLYKLPQEKLLYSGASALTDVELLALILRTGTADRKVLELARDVMAYADNLSQSSAMLMSENSLISTVLE